MPALDRAHYHGDYPRRAAAVRAAAYADPTTECESIDFLTGARCGRTLAEHTPGATWHAGHENDSEIGGRLRPEVSECNQRNGLLYGQARKRRKAMSTSRDW